MISYCKTQWFILLIAVVCLVMSCIYAFKPAPEVLTVEALDEVMTNVVTASFYFIGFVIWSFISFISYNRDRIELLEKKAEKYDAMYDLVQELLEANKLDREHMDIMASEIKHIAKYIDFSGEPKND